MLRILQGSLGHLWGICGQTCDETTGKNPNPTRVPHHTSCGQNITTRHRLQDDEAFSLAATVSTSNFNVSGLVVRELRLMVALADASDSLRATLGTSASAAAET